MCLVAALFVGIEGDMLQSVGEETDDAGDTTAIAELVTAAVDADAGAVALKAILAHCPCKGNMPR